MWCMPSETTHQELIEFRKLNTPIENVEIPARSDNRTITDKKGFIFFGIAVLILLPFLIYSLTKSDRRYINYPTDDCGNFCGFNNTHVENVDCSGRDNLEKPYLDGDIDGHWCSRSCGDSKVMLHRICLFEHEAKKLHRAENINAEDVLSQSRAEWWKFLLTAIVTIVLSVLTLRYRSKLAWTMIILSMVLLIAVTGGFWFMVTSWQPDSAWYPIHQTMFVATITLTVICVALLIVFLVSFERIALVIQLHEEATKIFAAMPQLVLVSIMTILIQFFILGIFFTNTLHLALSFDVYKPNSLEDKVTWYYSPTTIFTIVLNSVVTIWTMWIIAGIQYMTVSLSVSSWYFAKYKHCLTSTVLTSTKVTIRYHLGTIAFGSFLMMLFSPVQVLVTPLCRNLWCRCLIVRFCPIVEVMFKFISESSYIETGIHGQSFYKSAKRATKLLLANARNIIPISCVGDFVLATMITFLIIMTTAISFAIFIGSQFEYVLIRTLICFAVNLITICIIFATFQTVIETLLICTCEDSLLNDGILRPFYMSRDLLQIVEQSKKMYGINGDTM